MTVLVPEKLTEFWAAMPGGYPPLRLSYTESLPLPQAVYESTGFAGMFDSSGYVEHEHRYDISLIGSDPAAIYSQGLEASLLLDAFDPPGTEWCRATPARWATPLKAGQLDVWVFKVTLEIRIVPG
jgi:hypothetical protein